MKQQEISEYLDQAERTQIEKDIVKEIGENPKVLQLNLQQYSDSKHGDWLQSPCGNIYRFINYNLFTILEVLVEMDNEGKQRKKEKSFDSNNENKEWKKCFKAHFSHEDSTAIHYFSWITGPEDLSILRIDGIQEKYNTWRKMEALNNPDHFHNCESEDTIEVFKMFIEADFIEPKEMKFLDFFYHSANE